MSQILLALALAALLFFLGENSPAADQIAALALFIAGTVISLFFSGHAREGTPQIRKFFVFLIL